jgi:hypothetical protein
MAALFNIGVNRALLPMLIYVPQSVAMRELGLYRVTTDRREAVRLILRCAEQHRSGPIKVICISGRHLFREETMPFDPSLPVPLRRLAELGQLEVIMPESNPENPTVLSRYKTYTREYCRTYAIPTVERFVEYEIKAGKHFLRQANNNNVLFEHSMLCMWRVIIFSEHCFVQSYFPNLKGGHSFEAPMFVYVKRADKPDNSYYELFSHLYFLLKENAIKTAALRSTPPV